MFSFIKGIKGYFNRSKGFENGLTNDNALNELYYLEDESAFNETINNANDINTISLYGIAPTVEEYNIHIEDNIYEPKEMEYDSNKDIEAGGNWDESLKDTFDDIKFKPNLLQLIFFKIQKIVEDVEGYQIVGFIGCILMLIGCFYPVISVKCIDINDTIIYIDDKGTYVFILALISLILIVSNKHKYSFISASMALAVNISILLGISYIKEFIKFEVGYYLVWIGGLAVVISTLLINTGYARDSGFRHNKPLYAKDIFWICTVLFLVIIIANIASGHGDISKYVKEIKDIEENGFIIESNVYLSFIRKM